MAVIEMKETNGVDTKWKKDRFINCSFTDGEGKKHEIDALGLQFNKRGHTALINWIDKDPEVNIPKLLAHIEFTYNDPSVKKEEPMTPSFMD